MGRELYEQYPGVRSLFDRAQEILGFDLRAVCVDGPAERLEATDISQPAIFVASLAALEALRAEQPEVVAQCQGAAGLSLGEYTALVFAGSLDFESGLRVVQRRGQAMQAAALASPSGMTTVIGLAAAKIDELCARVAPHGRVWKANMLGPGTVVVSGDRSALEQLEPVAMELGAMKVVPLAVAGAFHTPLMKPADEQLAAVLAAADVQAPRLPVYSNVTAEPHLSDPAAVRDTLARQVTVGVRWEESMQRMLADGFDTFYEIGPGRALTSLLKRISRRTPCTSIPAR